MHNNILNWSYTLPTEPGMYLCCYGDVETQANIRYVTITSRIHKPEGGEIENILLDQDGDPITDYTESHKWARLLVGSEARA